MQQTNEVEIVQKIRYHTESVGLYIYRDRAHTQRASLVYHVDGEYNYRTWFCLS